MKKPPTTAPMSMAATVAVEKAISDTLLTGLGTACYPGKLCPGVTMRLG